MLKDQGKTIITIGFLYPKRVHALMSETYGVLAGI